MKCGLCDFASSEKRYSKHLLNVHADEMETNIPQHFRCDTCEYENVTEKKVVLHKAKAHTKVILYQVSEGI